MNCKKCGTQLTGSETNCPACGAAVENTTQPVDMAGQGSGIENSTVTGENVIPVEAVNNAAMGGDTTNPPMPDANNALGQVDSSVTTQPSGIDNSSLGVEQNQTVPVNPVMPSDSNIGTNTNINQVSGGLSNNQQVAPSVNQSTTNGNKNKTLILIVVLVVVVAIFVVLLTTVFKGKSNSSSGSNNDNTGTTNVGNTKTSSVTYAGYTFTLPEGYTYQISDDPSIGLLIMNESNTVFYTLLVDYSNSIDAYKEMIATEYSGQVDDLFANVSGREYLAVTVKEDNFNGVFYASSTSDGGTYLGYVLRQDNVYPTATDLQPLTTILNSGKDSTSFAPGSDSDAGKSGFVKPSVGTGKKILSTNKN